MSSAIQSAGVLKFEEAYRTVLDYCRQIPPPPVEEAPLPATLGRVLAQTLLADRDFPPFHRATRDGYAVRSSDLKDVPLRLRVIGKIKAGASFGAERGIEAGNRQLAEPHAD